MDGSLNDLAGVPVQLARLVERMDALERRIAEAESAPPKASQASGFADQLQRRFEANPVGLSAGGFVAYAGAVRGPGGELVWDAEHTVADLLDADPDGLAQVLAALGSGVRLAIVRLLLARPYTSQELQDALQLASSGPLYYHLKELMAIGLITQPARNRYAIAPQRVVPFLAVLAAVLDIKA